MAKLRTVLAALHRWWTDWGIVETIGAALALAILAVAIGEHSLTSPVMLAAEGLYGIALVVNLAYGVLLTRRLIQRYRARKAKAKLDEAARGTG